MCRCWRGCIRRCWYGRIGWYRSVSRKGSGVIREQNVEGTLQLAALIDGGSPSRYAVQEEAYLAALETGVSGINHKAAIRAVGGDCRGWFRLVAVPDAGHQYRACRRLRRSTYEYQPGHEHHRLRGRRRWIRDLHRGRWLRRDRCRSIGRYGSRQRGRLGETRECQVEAGLYHRNSVGLVCVGLVCRNIA